MKDSGQPIRKELPREILVIRFGSLGDLCILGWSLAALPERALERPVRTTLVTKAAFAPLMSAMAGVDRVIPLAGSNLAALASLAGKLRGRSWDLVFDAHGVLRSSALLMLLGRRPQRKIHKDTRQRLALLRGSQDSSLKQRTMRDRFEEVFLPLGKRNRLPEQPPLGHLRCSGTSRPCLGLAPGAQWDTKRWPEEKFRQVLQLFLTRHEADVRVFLGPREEKWFRGSRLAALCGESSRVEVIQEKSLNQVASLLAGCSAVITNDSGLLHLAEATGTPVLALFGPTVQDFGYFPLLPDSQVLQKDLDCRPCSRNGKAPCHRGDLACLEGIAPEAALDFLDGIFSS